MKYYHYQTIIRFMLQLILRKPNIKEFCDYAYAYALIILLIELRNTVFLHICSDVKLTP